MSKLYTISVPDEDVPLFDEFRKQSAGNFSRCVRALVLKAMKEDQLVDDNPDFRWLVKKVSEHMRVLKTHDAIINKHTGRLTTLEDRLP